MKRFIDWLRLMGDGGTTIREIVRIREIIMFFAPGGGGVGLQPIPIPVKRGPIHPPI